MARKKFINLSGKSESFDPDKGVLYGHSGRTTPMPGQPYVVPEWPGYSLERRDGRVAAWTRCHDMIVRSPLVATEGEALDQLAKAVPGPSEFGPLPPILAKGLRREGHPGIN